MHPPRFPASCQTAVRRKNSFEVRWICNPEGSMPKVQLVVLACLAIVCSGIAADDEPKSKPLDRWVKYYTEVAQGYDIRLKSAPDEPLTVSAEPILVYSNPTIGFDTHGAFFVWTKNGRAEAIGAIWSKRIGAEATSRKNVNHE